MTVSGIVTPQPTVQPTPEVLVLSQHLTPVQKQGLMILVLSLVVGIIWIIRAYRLWRKEEDKFHG